MRPVPNLGAPPPDVAGKLDWCVKAIQKIALASQLDDPNKYADEYTFTNATADRTMDCNAGVLANLAAAQAAIDETRDVLATFIQDHQSRGSKRSA